MAKALLLATLFKFALYSQATTSLGPITDLQVTDGPVNPDGYLREGILVENSFPSPPILGSKGGQFKINVVDRLTNITLRNTTTIHWHGIFQRGTNWADGPAFVTQCPITPGNSFLYDFNVPGQAGTFWYHSHLRTQYCDGLRGPLVVYDPLDPFAHLYDIDDASTIITLADWYHTAAANIAGAALADSTLINGLGRYTGGPASPLSVITVTRGKRYRFRLINIACDPSYTFSIDGHSNLTVIEVDGVNHQPLHVDSIPIFVAQRYSFILDANQPVGNYWIRAAPDAGQTKLAGFAGGINSAILRYVGAPDEEPTTSESTSVNPLNEVNLHPLINPEAPGGHFLDGADQILTFNLSFANGRFLINGTSFVPPTVPVLLQVLSGAKTAQELLPTGSVYSLPKNSVIQIVLPPGTAPGGPHPFHLHGHTFSVIRSAGSSVYNYDNPVQRDTVAIGSGSDMVTIRFVTNNPGPWFLHCHIDFHLDLGFAVVLAEDIPDIAKVNPVPSDWEQLCPLYDAGGWDGN